MYQTLNQQDPMPIPLRRALPKPVDLPLDFFPPLRFKGSIRHVRGSDLRPVMREALGQIAHIARAGFDLWKFFGASTINGEDSYFIREFVAFVRDEDPWLYTQLTGNNACAKQASQGAIVDAIQNDMIVSFEAYVNGGSHITAGVTPSHEVLESIKRSVKRSLENSGGIAACFGLSTSLQQKPTAELVALMEQTNQAANHSRGSAMELLMQMEQAARVGEATHQLYEDHLPQGQITFTPGSAPTPLVWIDSCVA